MLSAMLGCGGNTLGGVRDGVLETTKERLKYFGLLFQGKRADFFAESNLR
jgi:hypothetical protein